MAVRTTTLRGCGDEQKLPGEKSFYTRTELRNSVSSYVFFPSGYFSRHDGSGCWYDFRGPSEFEKCVSFLFTFGPWRTTIMRAAVFKIRNRGVRVCARVRDESSRHQDRARSSTVKEKKTSHTVRREGVWRRGEDRGGH